MTMPRTTALPTRPGLRLLALLLLAAAPLLATGCGGDSTYEIQEVRHEQPTGPATPQDELKWVFDLPEGWTERQANPRMGTLLAFTVAGREDTSCTFSILGGSGGGLAANVNRWRRQMGLEPLSEEAVAALPRRGPFLTTQAVEVDLEGAFGGMGGETKVENAGLLGWILTQGQDAAFLKMTGPREVVVAERERFAALGSSLKLIRTGKPAIPESGELPAGHPPIEPELPAGHPPMDPGGMAPGGPEPAGPVAPSSLTWKAPEGWEKQPARMMREVTYVPAGKTKTQCYVSIARGALADNINRWRGQLGEASLSADDIAKLDRVPMLGGEGVLVQIVGSFKGMGAEGTGTDAMLGVVFERSSDSVFVKMIGPKDDVLAERANFEAFCRSLNEQE